MSSIVIPQPDPRREGIDAPADRAGYRANQYRLEGFHCSESVLRAAVLAVEIELPETLLRGATGFRGGGGGVRCGALNSGAMLHSLTYGKTKASEDNTCASELTKVLHERFCKELGATRRSMLFPFYSRQAPDHSCSIVYAAGTRIVVRLLSEAPAICSTCSLPASLGVLRGVQFQEENNR